MSELSEAGVDLLDALGALDEPGLPLKYPAISRPCHGSAPCNEKLTLMYP